MKPIMNLLMVLLLISSSCNKLPKMPNTPNEPKSDVSTPTYEITDTVDVFFNQMHVFEGDTYRTQIHVHKPVLKRYINKPVVQSMGAYIVEDPQYPYIETIAEQVYAPIAHRNFTDDQLRRYLIAYAQQLPYEYDPVLPGGGDLIKNPLATIATAGDCEDHTLVAYVLLEAFGLNECRAVEIPYATLTMGHMALAIRVEKPVGRTYYEKQTGKYFSYVEATGPGYLVGLIPYEYANKAARLIDLPYIRPLRITSTEGRRHSHGCYENTSGSVSPEKLAALDYSAKHGLKTEVINVTSEKESDPFHPFRVPVLPEPTLPEFDIEGLLSEVLSALLKLIPAY